MYNISKAEFEYCERIIYKQREKFRGYSIYDADEFYNMGLYALGKACATYSENKEASFVTYASHCIVNEFRMYIRSNFKYSTNIYGDEPTGEGLVYFDMIPNTTDDIKHLLDKLDLDEAMELLSNRQYEMLSLWSKGYKQKEIAEMLNTSLTNVGTTIGNAVNKLRKSAKLVR